MLIFFVVLINILAYVMGIFLLVHNYSKLSAIFLLLQLHIGTISLMVAAAYQFPDWERTDAGMFAVVYYALGIIIMIWIDKKAYYYHMLEMEAAKKEMEEYYANMTPEERTTEFMNDWTMQLAEMRRKQNRKWYQFW